MNGILPLPMRSIFPMSRSVDTHMAAGLGEGKGKRKTDMTGTPHDEEIERGSAVAIRTCWTV